MVKKHATINLIILFFCLFSFAKSQSVEWLNYDFVNGFVEKKETSAPQKKSYGIDFQGETGKIQFYMKIEVTSDDDNPAPLLCFSSNDQNCKGREQLAKNAVGKSAVLWLKREEFNKDDQELFILVECAKSDCKYTLRVEGFPQPTFSPNFVYSYVVNSYNREMRFDIEGSETDVYLTVSLDGSSKASLTIDNVYREGIDDKSGKTLTFLLENSGLKATNLASILVRNAEVGEYITLSAHLVSSNDLHEGLAPNEYLLPNGPEITGYLESNVLNEECFPLDLADSKYKNMDRLYITGRIHTKYAWFFLEDENRNYLEETDVEILDGQLGFVFKNNHKMNYVCLELPNEATFKQYRMGFSN